MSREELKRKSIALRQKGMSYSMIQEKLGVKVPKSTFAYWFRDVQIPTLYIESLKRDNLKHLIKARKLSRDLRMLNRQNYLQGFFKRNLPLKDHLANPDIAKIVLTILYLGEGSKNPKRGGVVFGNSDPAIIKLFLTLMRRCYEIDEAKFRCTVQCRSDQNLEELNRFWARTTGIPLHQFYTPRIDSRSQGKKTEKRGYKGVCRLDYFSAEILIDLLSGIKVLTRGL